jgi:signal transduction histidine kinase
VRRRHPGLRRPYRWAAVYVAAWVPVTLAYAAAIAAGGTHAAAAATGAVATVVPAMGLGVLAMRWAERLAERRLRAGHLAAAHGVAALAYATAWVAATAGQLALFASPTVLARYVANNAAWEWVSGLFLYGVLAGVAHGAVMHRLLGEREAAAARAELHALRAQLDPHFLFNTLHSLMGLARRDPAAVERGLERFGDLLRYVLAANRQEAAAVAHGDVPLEAELGFVRDYLALERMRLGARLQVEEAVDDEALECALPALTLQPLVENAVRHGIAPRAAGGTVRVGARVTHAGTLVVEVEDDGAGCDAASADGAAGVGIAVVRRRLRARYGDAARLDVMTAPGRGFVARLTLPAGSAPAAAALPGPAAVWREAASPAGRA